MTRKRRYLISAGVLAVCVCIAIGVLAMLPPQPGVTKANFDRIENGMTIEEVAKLFGERPAYTGATPLGFSARWRLTHCPDVIVYFEDDSGGVYEKDWPESETIRDKICRWFVLR